MTWLWIYIHQEFIIRSIRFWRPVSIRCSINTIIGSFLNEKKVVAQRAYCEMMINLSYGWGISTKNKFKLMLLVPAYWSQSMRTWLTRHPIHDGCGDNETTGGCHQHHNQSRSLANINIEKSIHNRLNHTDPAPDKLRTPSQSAIHSLERSGTIKEIELFTLI